MLGIISGSRKLIVIGVARGFARRIAPRLARVPSTVASKAAPVATIKLLAAACCHCRLVKNSSYQRSEKPTGGNEMKSAELNEIGTTINVGSTMKQQTTSTIAFTDQSTTRR